MTTKIPPSLLTAPPVLTKYYKSPERTMVLGSAINLSHGLGETPKLVMLTLKCVTAEHGYSVGDEIQMHFFQPQAGTASQSCGYGIVRTSTQVQVLVGNNSTLIMQKSAFGYTAYTIANWRLIVEAWA